jgi:hypothetical protein
MKALADLWTSMNSAGMEPPCLLIDCAGVKEGRAGLPTEAFASLKCLLSGALGSGLADVAPYLGQLLALDDQSRAVTERLLQKQAAILVVPRRTDGFAVLYRHFRKYNVVYDPAGEPLFFRYYDPRVMLDVVRAVQADRLRPMLEPVQMLVMADETGLVQVVQTEAGMELVGGTRNSGT